MKWVFRLEAETGKLYLLPFSSSFNVAEVLHSSSIKRSSCLHLPKQYTLVYDDDAVFKGGHINFMASFYLGLASGSVVLGDSLILASRQGLSGSSLDGLDEVEARFFALSYEQAFGVHCDVPQTA